MFEHLATPGQQTSDDDLRSLMYGDYMGGKEEERSYDEVRDLDVLREVSAPTKTLLSNDFFQIRISLNDILIILIVAGSC